MADTLCDANNPALAPADDLDILKKADDVIGEASVCQSVAASHVPAHSNFPLIFRICLMNPINHAGRRKGLYSRDRRKGGRGGSGDGRGGR